MRYALDWCLFGYPQGDREIASAQCTTACGRISNALEINLPNASASSTYDYCQDPEFLPNVGSCASCYKNVPNQLYLSNCKHSFLVRMAWCTKIKYCSSQYPRICMPETAFASAAVSRKIFQHLHRSTPVQLLNPRHQYHQHFLSQSLARSSGRYCNHRSCCCFPHLFIATRLLLCPQERSYRMSPPLRPPLKPPTPLQRKAPFQVHLRLE